MHAFYPAPRQRRRQPQQGPLPPRLLQAFASAQRNVSLTPDVKVMPLLFLYCAWHDCTGFRLTCEMLSPCRDQLYAVGEGLGSARNSRATQGTLSPSSSGGGDLQTLSSRDDSPHRIGESTWLNDLPRIGSDWEIGPEDLTICTRPDGRQWLLGTGAFSTVGFMRSSFSKDWLHFCSQEAVPKAAAALDVGVLGEEN